MLLCCFRDNKADKDHDDEAKGRPRKGQKELNEVVPSSGNSNVAIISAKGFSSSSKSRPLKTALVDSSPSSGHNGDPEVFMAPVTFHSNGGGRPPRLSVCSSDSERFRPPSRDGSDRRDKERAPLAKEAKRLLKQKSQESFKVDSSYKSASSIPFIDASPPVVSAATVRQQAASVETSPQHKVDSVKPNANSTPNLPTSTPVRHALSMNNNNNDKSNYGKVVTSDSSLASNNLLNGSSNQLSKVEEKIQGRGMCRSNASYTIQQMLQEQVKKDEQEDQNRLLQQEVKSAVAKVTNSYEERLNAARTEYNGKIQHILREKTTAVNNARNTFESELKRQLTTFEKDLHEMRSKHNVELQKLEKFYNCKAAEQEKKYQESVAHYKARDETWQAEKEEVLGEIQRLKEEANRFIAILSQEEDAQKSDEMLSPGKRQSLTREVESLQLVVEMRTNELHKLREERTRHLQQLDELEQTAAQLAKANARVEDLTVQLATKTELERQLSWEKSQLENFFECETKNKARISMQVEELQWRIKHKNELPPTQVFSPTTNLSTTTTDSPGSFSITSTPKIDLGVTNDEAKTSNGHASENNSPDNTTCQMKNEACRGNILRPKRLDLEPMCKARPKSTASEDSLEFGTATGGNSKNYEKRDASKDDGLSDEGLGDIASEASNSPQPPANGNFDAKSAGKTGKIGTEKPPETAKGNKCDNENNNNNVNNNIDNNNCVNNNNNNNITTSPCDDRVPSRIPFSMQQTSL